MPLPTPSRCGALCATLWLVAVVLGFGDAAPTEANSSLNYRLVVKDCHADCVKYGNCNRDIGQCECPYGWEGPSCEVPLLPACRTSDAGPGFPLFAGAKYPRNCLCYRQLLNLACLPDELDRCKHYTAIMWEQVLRCYEQKDVLFTAQLSDMPSPDNASYVWYRGRRGEDAARKRNGARPFAVKDLEKLAEGPKPAEVHKAAPMSACPDRCSGWGTCLDGKCVCHSGRAGAKCETPTAAACPLHCSGRGTCMGGYCKCTAPYWGIGCSRHNAYEPAPGYEPPPTYTTLRVYMYDVPITVAGPVDMDDGLNEVFLIYQAYRHFMEQLAVDGAVRTENPWEANAFYVPTFAHHGAGNLGDPSASVISAVQWVQRTFPFYNRTKGRDHFVVLGMDRGACYLKPSNLTENLIKIVHFGMERANITDMGPFVENMEYGCFKNGRDIVMPPYFHPKMAIVTPLHKQLAEPGGAEQLLAQKDKLFFFSGDIRHNEPEYSGGVRQDLSKILQDHKYPDVVFEGGFQKLGAQEYERLLSHTKFCLAPYGHGWGIRLTHALMHGCVPVIIQDHVHQPFEDLLSYPDFSIRVARAELPSLVDLLRAVPEKEVLRLMRGTAAAYRAFIWQAELGGLAYNYTVASVWRRLSHIRGELHEWRRQRRRQQRGVLKGVAVAEMLRA